ncbi:glycosyltransferase [Vibrio vulnificus]|uniref:glycosyltransferase family 4 protein n=1 Tax=Vibrio vulnificus TaxID=672 RepID=UPI0007EE77D6|nr:glycosyltransferase family 4 protein [Vibrio vulnificus]ANN27782.1 glycosyltransferase [Vibrio vulnificus]
MKILHFCSYFEGSKVYENLFSRLSSFGVVNSIYIPVKRKCKKSLECGSFGDKYTVNCLSVFTRLFYCLKIFRIILSFPKISTFYKDTHFVHAHTLYSDGIPAFFYSRLKGIPLIITVRGTDVTLGFKYYFHYKFIARFALGYCNKIVFISPNHKKKFQCYFGKCYDSKLEVLPNGVDTYFIEHCVSKKISDSTESAIYVGDINSNKNIERSIFAFFYGPRKSNSLFHVVGGTAEQYSSVYGRLPVELADKVVFHGRLEKHEIISLMSKASVFIMNSHSETFGLVYLEAISQCLPIVYTKGQGVDGYFTDGQFGYAAEPESLESISNAINKAINAFPNGIGPFNKNPVNDYSWGSIAIQYMERIYK